jgi:hypothetical protein
LRHAEPPDLTGTGLTLLERAAEGEFGAWRAVDAEGRRFRRQGALNGDRVFDLATLFLLHTHAAPARLRTGRARRARARGYLAHMILRQTGWSIRYHEPDAGAQLVRDGLELSETFPS